MSHAIKQILSAPSGTPIPENVFADACHCIRQGASCDIYKSSVVISGAKMFFLTHGPEKRLGTVWMELGKPRVILRELSHQLAAELRRELSFLCPKLCGLRTSLGLGDRIGLAAPGHIRAIRGTKIFPFLAQQSIREMNRTHRTPEEVMDAATWGALQEGFTDGFGSDADHLKTPDDIDICAAAGFTMFTVDPGDYVNYVNNDADKMDAATLESAIATLPWAKLETTRRDNKNRYAGKTVGLGEFELMLSDEAISRAAVKYGAAVAYTAGMYRHLETVMIGRAFELEMSVDETSSPTTPVEHYYIGSELARLGVRPVSLAPRFIGDFEKGVDFKGDLAAFESTFAQHVAIANALGPYKISIHSGSDKFSIYGIAAKLSGGLVHVKTAGTSYLEALRTIASVDPQLFREVLRFAIGRWAQDRATCHVSADAAKFPRVDELADADLPLVLDSFDGRQLLHVTFGSVLTGKTNGEYLFRDRIRQTLSVNEEAHYQMLAKHLSKHAAPFARK